RMNCVGAVIQLGADFEDHPLVDVETGCRDLVHDRSAVACIDELERADVGPNSHERAIEVASRALLFVDEKDRLPAAIRHQIAKTYLPRFPIRSNTSGRTLAA